MEQPDSMCPERCAASAPSSEEEYDQSNKEDEGFMKVLAQSQADMEWLTEEGYGEDEPKKQETAKKQGNPSVEFGTAPSVTHCFGKWKLAPGRGYRVRQLSQDAAYRELFTQQELGHRTSVPLPLVCMNEKETLQILMNTVEEYCKILGAQHAMTLEVQERIEFLRLRVLGKSPAPLKENDRECGALASLHSWTNRLCSLLRRHSKDRAAAPQVD